MQAGPLSIIRRMLDDPIARAIDGMAPPSLPSLDVSGPIERVRHEVAIALASDDAPASWALDWLRQDIMTLTAVFASACGAARLRVHLQVIAGTMCPRFHIDNVGFRLVTTYRGPGTEWLSPRMVASVAKGEPLPAAAIRRLERGTIAVMRGGRGATAERPGVLHRSPAIRDRGTVRLFLAIDDIDGVSDLGVADRLRRT